MVLAEPDIIGREDIERAAARLNGRIRVTPTTTLEEGVLGLPARLTLKLETVQHSGAFKVRGAFNRMLSADAPAQGVIAAPGGNHGAAVAHAARELGAEAEVFVPKTSPPVKVERIRSYGARVTLVGDSVAAAIEAAEARAAETGAHYVHAYDQPEVVAGQGTLGLELGLQAPDLDTVLVAVGGGGLIGGIASWYRGAIRVVGVEPHRAPTLSAALASGKPVEVRADGAAADSLGAGRVGNLAFRIAEDFVDRVVLVADESILTAQHWLWDTLRIVVEPGGATALAALLSGAYRPQPDERVGVLLCGANADPAQLSSSRGEAPTRST